MSQVCPLQEWVHSPLKYPSGLTCTIVFQKIFKLFLKRTLACKMGKFDQIFYQKLLSDNYIKGWRIFFVIRIFWKWGNKKLVPHIYDSILYRDYDILQSDFIFLCLFKNWDHNFYFYTCSFQSEALVFGKSTWRKTFGLE